MYQYYFDDDLILDLSKSLVLLVKTFKNYFSKFFYFIKV